MEVGFQFNFGLGWGERGLVSGSLLFQVLDISFITFFGGVGVGGGGVELWLVGACFGTLRGHFFLLYF